MTPRSTEEFEKWWSENWKSLRADFPHVYQVCDLKSLIRKAYFQGWNDRMKLSLTRRCTDDDMGRLVEDRSG